MFKFFDEIIDEVFVNLKGLLFHGGSEVLYAVVEVGGV